MQIRSRFLYVRPSLVRAIGAVGGKPKKKPAITTEQRSRALTPNPKISDETVAAMRFDFEVRGHRKCVIARTYGVDWQIVSNLVEYATRAHIEPYPGEA